MRRKVIQLAGKTHVVSLPSFWIKKQGIKKGDELNLEISGKKVVITSESSDVNKILKLHLEGNEEFVKRRISAAYKKGIDLIEASVSKPELIQAIQEKTKTLLGFEILNRGLTTCTIKNIAQPLEETVDIILRRVFFIIQEMGVIVALLSRKFDEKLLNELKSLEELTDKLTNVCKRTINNQFSKDSNQQLLYCIIWEAEKIADEYVCLGSALANNSKKVQVIIEETNALFKLFHEIFASFSEEKGVMFTKKKRNLEKQAKELLEKNPKFAHYILNIIQRTHDILGPYYAMIL
ncbi:phosphate uptake regulator PhoU [Candidatus Woesearchaeota archaeon]|nr:phosphate uptake regulator PhoU [Candidatus Woesearchaeota archaeon]